MDWIRSGDIADLIVSNARWKLAMFKWSSDNWPDSIICLQAFEQTYLQIGGNSLCPPCTITCIMMVNCIIYRNFDIEIESNQLMFESLTPCTGNISVKLIECNANSSVYHAIPWATTSCIEISAEISAQHSSLDKFEDYCRFATFLKCES